MERKREQLNRFLVDAFHHVLRMEERALRGAGHEDLSITEMHVIEAVCRGAREGGAHGRAIAQTLGITPGTLTASVNVLEKKGYLYRRREQQDRRRVTLLPTDKGLAADQSHQRIHRDMVDAILAGLTPAQADALAHALQRITAFFGTERNEEHDPTIR